MSGRRRGQAGGDGTLPLGEDAAPAPAGPGAAAPGGPLAARMRPRTLDELAGQRHLLEPGSVLRALVEEGRLRSILLWGPAGSGKTTLAALVAGATDAAYVTLSAVTAGVADIRKAVEEAKARREVASRATVLFVDEVHRFSRTQQDALLPAVEAGWVTFIGATTENPFTSVTTPLLSRCLLLRLEALDDEDVRAIAERALADPERGLGGREAAPEAITAIVQRAEGDARVALNALEAAADRASARGAPRIEAEDVLDAMRQRFVRYDRAGDRHYDVVSAFIKSMRGSDPDAALAWLAQMIRGGEDPRFIARRMVIFASEDVGLADDRALPVAVAAAQGAEQVGFPEAQIILAHAAVYLALAPKSNAVVRAIMSAMEDAEERGHGAVPEHLRSGPASRAMGWGSRYKYPHAFPEGRVEQSYAPEGLEARRYWEPEPDLSERRRAGARLDKDAGDEEEGRP